MANNNKKDDSSEKRAWRRLKKGIMVQFKVKKLPSMPGAQVAYVPSDNVSQTKDLGEGGVCFTSSSAIPPQTILGISLQLPVQDETLFLEGEVVGCKEIRPKIVYAIRVKFINLQEEEKKILREFIQMFSIKE